MQAAWATREQELVTVGTDAEEAYTQLYGQSQAVVLEREEALTQLEQRDAQLSGAEASIASLQVRDARGRA